MCPRQRVVHKRAAEHLAAFVVDDFLEEGLAQSLNDTAVELTLDQQRVDDVSAVVDSDVAFDFDFTCVGGNFYDRDMRSERIGEVRRFEEVRFGHPRFQTFGQIHAHVRSGRDVGHAERIVRVALDEIHVVIHDYVLRVRLQEMRGDLVRLLSDLLHRDVQGSATDRHCAASEGADSVLDDFRISVDDLDVVDVDTETIREHLCERCLLALSMRGDAGQYGDLPCWVDTDGTAFPAACRHCRRGPHAADLDVGR